MCMPCMGLTQSMLRMFIRIQFANDSPEGSVRKQPTQKRAQVLVDSLVEAAGQVVVRDGLDALTTVRVAERAGVSAGSLYQYFADKDDLIAAVSARVEKDMIAAVDRVAASALSLPPPAFARALLDAAFEAMEARNGLGRELLRNWYWLDTSAGFQHFEQRMLDVLRNYALAHLREGVDPSPARAFVVINSVLFTLLRYLSAPTPPVFGRDVLVDELALMATGLLVRRTKR